MIGPQGFHKETEDNGGAGHKAKFLGSVSGHMAGRARGRGCAAEEVI